MAKGQTEADMVKEARLRSSHAEEKARLDDEEVRYMGPEYGPFKCGHCYFFVDDFCKHPKVLAPVDEKGCCNLYHSIEDDD